MGALICQHCHQEVQVNASLRVSFEDRLEAWDAGLSRYSKRCAKSPTKRHALVKESI